MSGRWWHGYILMKYVPGIVYTLTHIHKPCKKVLWFGIYGRRSCSIRARPEFVAVQRVYSWFLLSDIPTLSLSRSWLAQSIAFIFYCCCCNPLWLDCVLHDRHMITNQLDSLGMLLRYSLSFSLVYGTPVCASSLSLSLAFILFTMTTI